ncbi:MAG: nitroreductase family deazaflavin-dependent oxidoreductase [Chloroflexi bacterium]|nr:nitroreductase family deazaflavin-dependent oxidoreductase [Chloroflexota bacterium]
MPVELTPSGTYGAKVPQGGPRLLVRVGMSIVSALFRLRGLRIVTLTTIGARSGERRSTDLLSVPDGPDAWIVAASFAGSARHPAWYINMAKNHGHIWLKDGSRRLQVDANNLKGEARDEAYGRLIAIYQGYAGYQQKTDREIPVVRLSAVASAVS